jgi:hypothetical protein
MFLVSAQGRIITELSAGSERSKVPAYAPLHGMPVSRLGRGEAHKRGSNCSIVVPGLGGQRLDDPVGAEVVDARLFQREQQQADACFRGKIHNRTLTPGRYRLRVTALHDEKPSATATIRFTIAR